MIPFLALIVTTQTKIPQGDAAVQAALVNLRQESSVFLKMQGEVQIGRKPLAKSEKIECDAYWQESTTKNVQSEVLEYRGGELQTRLVADGRTVWNYNVLAHEYRSTDYKSYGFQETTPIDGALYLLREDASHVGAHTTRLLEQVYGGAAATYQSWIPGATVRTIPDPLIPDMIDVIYSLGTPARRQVTFKILTSNSTLKLAEIDYEDKTSYQGQPRTVTWTLTPNPEVPAGANFKPYPGNAVKDWKVIAGGN